MFSSRRRVGIFLLVVGLFLFILNYLRLGWLMILLISGALLLLGYWKKEALWMMPGSIFSGVGLAMFMTRGPFVVAEEHAGGVFIFTASLGWFGVTFLSRRYARDVVWWTLIPGLFMVGLGWATLLRAGWLQVPLRSLILTWPFALVGLGLLLMLNEQNLSADEAKETT